VPKFSSDAEAASPDGAIGNNRATDSGAKSKHDHILGTLACAKAIFCPTGGIRVILDHHAPLNAFL
jgi:hypothetical protein